MLMFDYFVYYFDNFVYVTFCHFNKMHVFIVSKRINDNRVMNYRNHLRLWLVKR